jgi:hypothetical protein
MFYICKLLKIIFSIIFNFIPKLLITTDKKTKKNIYLCDMKTLYISGKISGRQLGEAQHHFFTHQKLIEKKGYRVINPFDLHEHENKTWEEFMRVDVKALCDCDGIIMLNGWEDSRGAKLELLIAKELGLSVFYENAQMNIIGIYED